MAPSRSPTSARKTLHDGGSSPSATEQDSHDDISNETTHAHRFSGRYHGHTYQNLGAGLPQPRDRMDQLAAVDGEGPAGEGRAGPVLDLLLHQLAPHDALSPRVGGEVPGQGAGGDRRALARVRVREAASERPVGRVELPG